MMPPLVFFFRSLERRPGLLSGQPVWQPFLGFNRAESWARRLCDKAPVGLPNLVAWPRRGAGNLEARMAIVLDSLAPSHVANQSGKICRPDRLRAISESLESQSHALTRPFAKRRGWDRRVRPVSKNLTDLGETHC